MPGVTKRLREERLNSFATDLSMRCQTEFENIHRKTNGDTLKLQKHIAMTTDAITTCYQGGGGHRLCPSKSPVCEGLSDSNRNVSKKKQVRCRSSKRKIKRKFRRNNLYSLYEKHREKISYRKAKLLLEKAETRQLKAKVNKDHFFTLKSSKLRQTTKNDHTYSISMTVKIKQSSGQKMQGGECSIVQLPRLKQASRNIFCE